MGHTDTGAGGEEGGEGGGGEEGGEERGEGGRCQMRLVGEVVLQPCTIRGTWQ